MSFLGGGGGEWEWGGGVYTSECLMSRCVYSGSFPLNSKTFDSIAKQFI